MHLNTEDLARVSIVLAVVESQARAMNGRPLGEMFAGWADYLRGLRDDGTPSDTP